jgi:hypothetical protein
METARVSSICNNFSHVITMYSMYPASINVNFVSLTALFVCSSYNGLTKAGKIMQICVGIDSGKV